MGQTRPSSSTISTTEPIPTAPSLASQRQDYLEKALTDYRAGTRTSPEMAAMSSILSDDDIKAIEAARPRPQSKPPLRDIAIAVR